MAASTMTPNNIKAMDEGTCSIKDRVLGAMWAVTRGTARPVNMAELRERLHDLAPGDFERTINTLDRDGVLVLDRGGDATYAKMAQTGVLADNVPCSVKQRVLGAILMTAQGPGHVANLNEVRARLGDLAPADLDRVLVALVLRGEVELGRGHEIGWIRLGHSHAMPMAAFSPETHGHFMNAGYTFSSAPNHFAHRMITERLAQQLWETRGRQPGQDMQNWLEAERVVRQQYGCFAN
jgi:Protein of unknown function (DUF2934)